MEPSFGRGLDGLAGVVANKWFAVMGLAGMILFLVALVAPIPTDRTAVICIGLMMMGWGFGMADCRTFRERIGYGVKITGPAFRLTVTGFLMFAIAICAAIFLARHLLF